MQCFFVDIEEFEHEFFLFDDEIDDKIRNKFKKMGFPNIWVQYPSKANDKFTNLGGGIFQQGDFQCSSFPLIEPTSGATFEINYNNDKNTVSLNVGGTFFSGNDPQIYENDDETEFMLSRTEGIIQVITLNNEKGKPIKKKKDEWGMTDPIEGLAADLEYNSKGYGLRFKIYAKHGMYQDGRILTE